MPFAGRRGVCIHIDNQGRIHIPAYGGKKQGHSVSARAAGAAVSAAENH
jgi:hypothetical protein